MIILNPWASSFKVRTIFCLTNNFLSKLTSTYCVKISRYFFHVKFQIFPSFFLVKVWNVFVLIFLIFFFFLLNHNSVVMTVFSCGILLFSFSFLVVMASEETSHGEILSRSVFLALFIRFWLLTELFWPLTEVGKGNFDLLLLVTDDKDRVTGWFEAKDVSWNWLKI